MSHYQIDKIFHCYRLLFSNYTLSPPKCFVLLLIIQREDHHHWNSDCHESCFRPPPDSHVLKQHLLFQLYRKVDCAHCMFDLAHCTPDTFPSGPESRLGHRERHRIAIIPIRPATLFLPLYVQITNRKPRKETLGNLWIEYWGQFGGYALRRRASNTPRIIYVKTTIGKDDNFGDLHEAAVAPPGLRAAHLHPGHFMPLLFAAWRSTADCCPVARAKQRAPRCHWLSRGRWAAWWAVLGTAPGYSGTSHTSPTPQTKLIQTWAHKQELISLKDAQTTKVCLVLSRFCCRSWGSHPWKNNVFMMASLSCR